jgi:hypothetical protein
MPDQQVRVGRNGAPQGPDMDDAFDHIDHLGDRPAAREPHTPARGLDQEIGLNRRVHHGLT